MALLGFERGVSVLGQQVGFERELNDLIDLAREQRRPRRPGPPRPARRAERGVRGDARQRRPVPDRGDTRGGQRREARLGRVAPASGRAGDGGLRRRVADRRRRGRTTWTAGRASSSSPAPTRCTAAATRSSATSWPSACSACPRRPADDEHATRAAHARLRPGARPAGRQGRRGDRGGRCRHRCGRGTACARGGREPGGHQRHPRAASRRVAGVAGRGVRRGASPCPRRRRDGRGPGPGATRRRGRARWRRRDDQQRRPRRHRRRPGDDRRRVVEGPGHHPDRHLPVRPGRGQPHEGRRQARA